MYIIWYVYREKKIFLQLFIYIWEILEMISSRLMMTDQATKWLSGLVWSEYECHG